MSSLIELETNFFIGEVSLSFSSIGTKRSFIIRFITNIRFSRFIMLARLKFILFMVNILFKLAWLWPRDKPSYVLKHVGERMAYNLHNPSYFKLTFDEA